MAEVIMTGHTAIRPVIRVARPGDASCIALVETETWRDAYPTLLPGAYLVQNLGARLVARTHHDFAGQRLPSVVYLWTDLKTLADSRAA